MNAVINMVKLMDKTQLDLKQKEYLDILDHSSSLLLNIIDDILNIAKLESGHGDVDIDQFNINHLFKMIAGVFRDKFSQKKIKFIVDIDPSLPEFVESDELKINQILINLISNALKFTDVGQVILKVDLGTLSESLTMVEFSIIDSGQGINEENKLKIFNKFTQADNSMTREFSGGVTGMSCI